MHSAQSGGKNPDWRTVVQKSGPESSQLAPHVGQTTWAEPSGRPDSNVTRPVGQPEPVVSNGLRPAGKQSVGAAPVGQCEVLDDQLALVLADPPQVRDRDSGVGPFANHAAEGSTPGEQVRGPGDHHELAVVDGRPEGGRAGMLRLLVLLEAEDAVQIVKVVEVQSSPLSLPSLLS